MPSSALLSKLGRKPSTDAAAAHGESVVRNPSQIDYPAFLMNVPFSIGTGEPNNPWMEDLSPDDRQIDIHKALIQFIELYNILAANALVYLLPTPQVGNLQDLVYTANLGLAPEHIPDKNDVIISNFTSLPRCEETDVGVRFFDQMGYRTHVCPHKFEGEADLKHLRDNIYVGGYGIRSEYASYEWMERTFDMKIIKVQMMEKYLYHLDCTIFPLSHDKTMVCTELYNKNELDELSEHTQIIEVSVDSAMSGITNSVRLNTSIINASNIHQLKSGTEDYEAELNKNYELESIARDTGFDLTMVNLSEYQKSGALLSCMVMHLNRFSQQFDVL